MAERRYELDWLRVLAVLLVASLVLTAAVYDVLVRRWRATRFLFGMRPLEKPAAARLPEA